MLRARLLGALEVELNGTAIDSPARQRPWALFAYLALAPSTVSRSELANTFWPDVLDQSARASLRSALWALRRQLGEALVVDGERVGLGEAWIDVREFERLAADDPAEALDLCRGELLEGVEDEWALAARDRHRERVIDLLERQACGSDDERRAIEFSKRQVEHDPLDEAANRRLITRLGAAGDRAAALRVYQALADRLRRELGVAPSTITRELVDSLRTEIRPEVRTTPIPGLLPLVGRERELGELMDVWQAAASGVGGVAVVRGEAGIGKTRLTTELRIRASASGANSAACAALDLGGTAPFSLWAELIRELLPALPAPPQEVAWPDDLAVLVAELPGHFAREGGPRASAVAPDLQRTRLFEAVVSLLGWAARAAPLLLVLEDAHDADASSLELAGYAARRVAAMPVLMVITRRDQPGSAEADRLEHALRSRGLICSEQSLGPLSAEAVATLARTAAQLPDADVTRVVERAEGNALLAVETARVINERVAPSIRGSVRAALSPLSGDVRHLIETAAVAARALEAAEVDQLALHDAAAQALETGLLMSDGGRLGFRHALLREAAFEEIAEPRRRSLHKSWAQALVEAGHDGAEVARHLRLAGADPESVPHLVRAAADARDVAALGEAAAYLEEALAIAPDRAQEWLELGEIEAWRGRRDEAEAAFRRALGLLEEGDRLAMARGWLCKARAYHGPLCVPRTVLESAQQALKLLDDADGASEERSEAIAGCAWAEAVVGNVDEAERLLVALSAEAASDDNRRTYDAGHARAHTLMMRGQFAESYAPFIAAAHASVRAGRPDLAYGCWANAAGAAAAAGEPDRALEFIDRGMEAVADQGLQSIEIQLLAARSFVLRGVGRLDEARQAAESEHALAERVGQTELLAMASHDRGLLALSIGDYSLAAELLAGALVDGARVSRPLTRLALAEALACAGDPTRAEEQIRATVLEPLKPSDFPDALVPRLARVQGLVALARGDEADAKRRLEESIAGWERLLRRNIRAETIGSVLADLGRPVVGLVEPERELAKARRELEAIKKETQNAVVH